MTPMATTVHENPEIYGEQSREFNGFQWAEQNKEAVMTGPAHIVFGLGRFACPGRVLAINGQTLAQSCLRITHAVAILAPRDQAHRALAHRPCDADVAGGQVRGLGSPEHGTPSFDSESSWSQRSLMLTSWRASQVTQPPKGTLVMAPLEKAYL